MWKALENYKKGTPVFTGDAVHHGQKIEQIIEKFTIGPRNIISQKVSKIAEGETANLTLLNPEEVWTVKESDIRSKSKNNPFIEMQLTGKIKAVINKGKHLIL